MATITYLLDQADEGLETSTPTARPPNTGAASSSGAYDDKEQGYTNLRKYLQSTLPFPKNGRIQGTTLVEGLLTPNLLVRVYHRESGDLVAEARSNGSGVFTFDGLAEVPEAYYVVGLDPAGGYAYNAKIFDLMTPQMAAPWEIQPRPIVGGGQMGVPRAQLNPTGLGLVNVLSGLASSCFTAVGSPFSFTAAKVNDGEALSQSSASTTNCWLTTDQYASSNNGRGVLITLPAAKRLGRMEVSCFPASADVSCDFKVEAWDGSAWVAIATAPLTALPTDSGYYAYQTIDLPAEVGFPSTQWRLTQVNWVQLGSNFYAGEVRAYEWLT